jgi:hypothetical protein
MKISVGRTVTTAVLITLFTARAAAGGILQKQFARAPTIPPAISSWAKWPGAPSERASQKNAQSPKTSGKPPVPKPISNELPRTESRMDGTSASYATSTTAGNVSINYEVTPPERGRGGSTLDENIVLRNRNIDSVMFYMNSLHGYTVIRGWWAINNPFSPADSFNVNVCRIRAEPGHVTQYWWNIFVPQGGAADPAPGNPNFRSDVYGTLTVQGNPYGSARVWVVSTDTTLVTEDFIRMAGAYADSIHFVSADPLPAAFSKGFDLRQNYPNPFNSSTAIEFDLPKHAHVAITVHDVLGRKVAELANGNFDPGTHSLVWNPGNAASGIYFIMMQSGDTRCVVQANLIK